MNCLSPSILAADAGYSINPQSYRADFRRASDGA